MAELFDQIDELRRSPGKVAVATLVNTRGTTPRKEGAKMLVGEGGSVLGGGTIEVFVEPLTADLLERVRAHNAKGGRTAIVTRLDGPVGAKILLLDDGTTTGTLGDAALDERFIEEARDAMTVGTSRTRFAEGTRAFVEVFTPSALLLVVGASHVSHHEQ